MYFNIATLFLTILLVVRTSFASPLETRTSSLSLKVVPNALLPSAPTKTRTALGALDTIPPNTDGLLTCIGQGCTGCEFFTFDLPFDLDTCFTARIFFSVAIIKPGVAAGVPASQPSVTVGNLANCTGAQLLLPTVNQCFNVEVNGVLTDFESFFLTEST